MPLSDLTASLFIYIFMLDYYCSGADFQITLHISLNRGIIMSPVHSNTLVIFNK